jgi:hypothetical protein
VTRERWRRRLLASLLLPALAPAGAWPQADSAAWSAVGRILQSPPATAAGYVRYNFPRRDITLRVADVAVAPALALGSWAGFAGSPDSATAMGDLVLLAREVPAVLRGLDQAGFAVTAIHNHLAGESPAITYVHFHARGRAVDLAAALDGVLRRTATPRPVTAGPAPSLTMDTAMVYAGLGLRGRASGAVAQFGPILVRGPVLMDRRTLVPAQAYPSPINIQQVSPDRLVATGDFAVREAGVQPLLQALIAHGITPTAMHSHLVGETPRIYYIHFWGDGRPAEILAGLRAALKAGSDSL